MPDMPDARVEAESWATDDESACSCEHCLARTEKFIRDIQYRTLLAVRSELEGREIKSRSLEQNPATLREQSLLYRGGANAFRRAVEIVDHLAEQINGSNHANR